MKHLSLIAVLLINSTVSILTGQDLSLTGFATVNAEGYDGTTGGMDGNEITVYSAEELQNAINDKDADPLIIYINSELTYDDKVDIKDVSDISILGVNASAGLNGFGLYIRRAENIIVRNLKIHHVPSEYGDAVGIDESHHVWIDHCELYSDMEHDKDYYDGLLDIKNGSRYVTVSWNYLHDHYKTSLIGHTDDAEQMAVDTMFKITYHHNYFHSTNSRNPSLRYGKLHVYNNYYKDIYYYCIASRKGAKALVENNYFEDAKSPVLTTFGDPPDGYACLTDNLYTGTSSEDENDISQTDCSWSVPYIYLPDIVDSICSYVPEYSGAGKIIFGEGGLPANIFTLSVDVTGSGTVMPDKGSYLDGTNIRLIAHASEGWVFNEWEGDITGSNDTINFIISSNTSVNAVFSQITSVSEVTENTPELKLNQNYPNPFSINTEIEFTVPCDGFVRLSVYTIDGRKIADIVNGDYSKGTYKTVLNRQDFNPGVYLYSIDFNRQRIYKKLIIE